MSGDALFPLPEPTFLFIHLLTVHNPSASPTFDPRGIPTKTFATSTTVGYLTSNNPNPEETAGTMRTAVEAVALVPNGTDVDVDSELSTSDVSVPGVLRKRFIVTEVRPNVSHTRILLRRMDEPWTYPEDS